MYENLLMAIDNSSIGAFMRENATAFPLVESIHVLALTIVVGTIAMVDLRLLGVSARNHAVSKLTTELTSLTWLFFGIAAVTGVLLFTSKAVDYGHNFFFIGKMLLIVAAAINMAVFELVTFRSVKNWDSDTPTPFAAKLAGLLSLIFWVSVVVFGRWIGFTIGGAF